MNLELFSSFLRSLNKTLSWGFLLMNAGKQKASILFIFVTVLVDVIGIGIIIPVIPDLIKNLGGLSTTDAAAIGGWLMFSFAFVQFFFAPILGELSDRFGRKPVLIMALFGLGLDYLFYAFAPTLFWLFVGRIIAGIFGASFSVAYSYIADISSPSNKAKNFGIVGAAFGLGFIIGPVIGGIAGGWGIKYPFFIAAALSLINMVYGILVLPESLKKENRRSINYKNMIPGKSLKALAKFPMIKGLVAAYFFIFLAGKALESTWSFYGMHKFNWSTTEIGYSLGVVGIMVAIVQGGLIGQLVKLFGQKRTILWGYAFWIIGFILFGIATQSWMMYAITIIYSIGGISAPTIQSVMSNSVPDNQQGELQGAVASLMSIAAIIGHPMFTSLFTYFTSDNTSVELPGVAFFLAAILGMVSFGFAAKSLLNGMLKA